MEADKETHVFKSGSTFDNAVKLYYFERVFRSKEYIKLSSEEIAGELKIDEFPLF